MFELKVFNKEGKEIEKLKLSEDIFDGKVNKGLLHQAVLMYQANSRKGLHSTKTRAYVSGGGRKPWRQKGTGRARAGSNRSPLWRHGGVIFGPHPRSYNFKLPQKIKTKALKSSINSRLKEDAVTVVDDIDKNINKTKEFNNLLNNLRLNESCLLVLDDSNWPLFRLARNIPYLTIKRFADINAFDVLANKKLLITKKALMDLSDRLNPVRDTVNLSNGTIVSNGVKNI